MYNNFKHNILIYNPETGDLIKSIKDPDTRFTTEDISVFKNYLISVAANGFHDFFFSVHELNDYERVLEWRNFYKTKKRSRNATAAYASAIFKI